MSRRFALLFEDSSLTVLPAWGTRDIAIDERKILNREGASIGIKIVRVEVEVTEEVQP